MGPQQGQLKLPKKLIDQLGGEEALSGSGRRFRGHNGSRKELRKAARVEKKTSRQPRLKPPYRKEEHPRLDTEEPSRRSPPVVERIYEDKPKLKSILKTAAKKDLQQATRTQARLPSPPVKIPRSVKAKLDEDDEEIAALEKKLGLKGKKSLPRAFKEDGLDELLEGLGDDFEDSEISNKKKRKAEGDDWLESKRKQARKAADAVVLAEIESETEDEEADGDTSQGSEDFSEEGLEDVSISGDDSIEDDFGSIDLGDDAEEVEDTAPRIRENPYVAPRSNDAAVSKYIPPSLRKATSSDSEELVRLRRQLQGLINRLTEANLLSILSSIEKLYADNPRQNVTSTLVDILLISVCEPTSLPDSLIILPAGFIAAVYKIVGTDFGAQVTQRITELFEDHYTRANAKLQDGPSAATSDISKETSNLIMLLSEMYNFQVVASNLIFDYIKVFLERLSELNAELLLKVIRASGPQLRQDDPSSLKDIVTMLRPAVEKAGGQDNISVRTKFMIETINDLKNNKMKTGGNASAVTSEHTIRMKKILGSLNSRALRGGEPLRIGLKDIRDSDKRGKWWLVGASWIGSGTVEEEHTPTPRDASKSKNTRISQGSGTSDIFQLARENRMNTDVRRAIFVAIMSADDFEDAYLRLIKLKLKKVQEYEIPKILTHCSGAEKVYNPYYTLISRKVCGDRKLKTAFQYCLWDLFKKMGESHDDNDDSFEEDEGALEMRHIVNLAKMFGTLIAEGSLSLTVLRNLNMSYLQTKTKMFVEVMLITILLHSQRDSKSQKDEQAVLNLFRSVKDHPQLIPGLQYFMRKVVSKTDIAGGKVEEATVKWACQVAREALQALIASDSTSS